MKPTTTDKPFEGWNSPRLATPRLAAAVPAALTPRSCVVSHPYLFTAAFSGLIALATAATLADQGRGSIRAEGRGGPAARGEARRPEPARAQPEAHRDVRAEPEAHRDVRPGPEAHRDPRPEPVRVEPTRRDWDTGDEDTRHFGGFAHPEPDHVLRGARFRALPDRHFDIDWNHQHYFWDYGDGFYVAQPDGQYLVVQPPIGVVVPELPAGAIPIVVGPTTYYYLDGVFYVPQANGFAVVNPPPGIVVPSLPAGAAQAIINGTVVYQLNGLNYTPILEGGVTAYTVTPA
jgi:hypothetical protein